VSPGIIGDGRLPNAGPEQILETFYRVGVFEWAHFGLGSALANSSGLPLGPTTRFGA